MRREACWRCARSADANPAPRTVSMRSQTMDKLQNAAGFRFHDRLHHQLATAIEDSDHDRFLVHVHADILNVATHAVASLRERSFALKTESFPQGKVSRFSQSAYLLFSFLPTSRPILHSAGPLSHNALTPKKANKRRKLVLTPVYVKYQNLSAHRHPCENSIFERCKNGDGC